MTDYNDDYEDYELEEEDEEEVSECHMDDEELEMYKAIFADPDFLYDYMLISFGTKD